MANKKNTEKIEVEKRDIDEVKIEILNYAEKKIDSQIESSVKKAEKKLLKQKNYMIVRRDIIILLLIILCGYLTYALYSNNYFDKYFENKSSLETKDPNMDETKQDEKKEDINALIEKYSYLLDSLCISENSSYIKDYYKGEITDELRLYLGVNKINNDKIINEDDTYIINEEDLKESYNSIFEPTTYNAKSFENNDSKVKYIKTSKIYILDKMPEQNSNIKRIITDINIDEDNLTISTIEGIVYEKKFYNIETKKSLGNYKNENSFIDNKNKLNDLKYHFKKEKDNYYLDKIEVLS